ncbi:unnamed protein product [Pleuronectes platessa]|uniref:Uncharacterized protein n=1 Tax=Pleuronectes platessa TaxID=8262 RepID=A0A9N7VJ47_PLEPL|nr:unnamed protein product [Pleuronectes platessa]
MVGLPKKLRKTLSEERKKRKRERGRDLPHLLEDPGQQKGGRRGRKTEEGQKREREEAIKRFLLHRTNGLFSSGSLPRLGDNGADTHPTGNGLKVGGFGWVSVLVFSPTPGTRLTWLAVLSPTEGVRSFYETDPEECEEQESDHPALDLDMEALEEGDEF